MSELNVYHRPTCPYCQKLISLLEKEKIKFTKKDITSDKKAEAHIVHDSSGHPPVPQVEYNGTIIFDYTTEEELVKTIKNWLN